MSAGPRQPKRLTSQHWHELKKANPYDPRTRLHYGGADYDRLDAEAIALGYERDGAFRPWYRRRVMALLVLTGDGDAFEIYNRLQEIHEAQREVADLTEALREWKDMTELIASVRGDAR
jgi:hypothetical protein